MTRDNVLREARSWLGTPYHHQGRVKGAGVDCAMILIEVYHACGLMPNIDPTPYPQDWHFHRNDERYLGWVKDYAEEVETPLPGDVVLFKFARCVSHGGIVLDWPNIIHSYIGQGVVYADATSGPLGKRLAGFWRVKGIKE